MLLPQSLRQQGCRYAAAPHNRNNSFFFYPSLTGKVIKAGAMMQEKLWKHLQGQGKSCTVATEEARWCSPSCIPFLSYCPLVLALV